jgi:hypothetical protein
MAKLPKSERDSIREEVRREREPFRPSSQGRFMSPNLEELYRDHASLGNVDSTCYISRRICSPLEYDVVSTSRG